MYNVCNSVTFIQYIIRNIKKKLLVIKRNPEICGNGECKRGWGKYYQCDCSGNVTPTPKPKFCWEGFLGIECKKNEDCGERGSCKPWMWTDTKYVNSIYLSEHQIKQTRNGILLP